MHIQDKVLDIQKQLEAGKIDPAKAQEMMMNLQMEYMPFLQLTQTGQPEDKIAKDGKELINLRGKKELESYAGKDFKDYEPDFYVMCNDLFKNKMYSLIYILALIVLGVHLFHAINSIFQTFGLNHKKYNNAIEKLAAIYAVIVPAGFAIVPLFVLFCK